jgi:transcription antitermination factor NusG
VQSIEAIRRTDGVADILSNAGALIALTPSVLADLSFAQTTGLFDETKPKVKPHFCVGDPVTVSSGRLQGFAGKIMRAPVNDRIFVVLDAIGTKVELPVADVEAA